ncbi:septum site-determining protein Ssd [Tessaracoccus antarcticus]|uniref:septum site-determining protein Ssd n=1 Tax=Tessaracoccus antarcticus TaxID=2479848 RepID=UPI001F359F6C|nr:septum site-determining protein Ssd [Tessaracoccus antarcticus]
MGQPTMSLVRTASEDLECLLVTRDASLVDAVSATALALGVTVEVAGDMEELRGLWSTAGLRLVGPDMAARAAALPRSHGDTWVVGQADSALLAASAELRVPALALPQSSAQLAEVMSRRTDRPDPGARLLALVGGSGGVGTSSLVVGLSLLAARGGQRVAVVELAEFGGGLDLLLGLEAASGVRWKDLAGATGELGSLGEQLVTGDGVSVLPLGRERQPPPTRAAVDAVLRSLGRSHDVVVVDTGDGRHLNWLVDAQVAVVVAAHVRGVAAARMVMEQHEPVGAQLLVRTGPGATLPAEAVSHALGLPLLGVVRHDSAVPRLSGMGVGITSGPARRFRRDVARVVRGWT